MTVNNAMTADFLRSAYGGESMAHMRYLIWSDSAEKDDFPNIGRLFKGVGYAELVHARNHFYVLKDQVGDSTVAAGAVFGHTNIVENLQGAINGELHEIDQMYPVYLEVAKFQDAQNTAKDGKDIGSEKIYVCPICGFTEIGDHVDNCPICGGKKDIFKSY